MLKNEVRIIGGKWRGRKIKFPDVQGLRPTPDRVRETLFNWLAPIIHGTRCLDLFAGSGANGFEALSRGAQEAVFVEKNRQVFEYLQANQSHLKSDQSIIMHNTAENFLKQPLVPPFDIVFLDPPFRSGLVNPCAHQLAKRGFITPQGYIYIETEIKEITTLELPTSWTVLKHKRAGQLTYLLLQNTPSKTSP